MPFGSPFAAEKLKIRIVLDKLARAGEITYYRELGQKVELNERWRNWPTVLNEIADEEATEGRPDLTAVVLNATNGWPSQVRFKDVGGMPSNAQKELAQQKVDAVFRYYCENPPAITLPWPPWRKRKGRQEGANPSWTLRRIIWPDGRPSTDPEDYEVIDDGKAIGRINRLHSRSTPFWLWSIYGGIGAGREELQRSLPAATAVVGCAPPPCR